MCLHSKLTNCSKPLPHATAFPEARRASPLCISSQSVSRHLLWKRSKRALTLELCTFPRLWGLAYSSGRGCGIKTLSHSIQVVSECATLQDDLPKSQITSKYGNRNNSNRSRSESRTYPPQTPISAHLTKIFSSKAKVSTTKAVGLYPLLVLQDVSNTEKSYNTSTQSLTSSVNEYIIENGFFPRAPQQPPANIASNQAVATMPTSAPTRTRFQRTRSSRTGMLDPALGGSRSAKTAVCRLDMHHEIFLQILKGKLHTAPLEDPQKVLDIGTGTGIWAIGMRSPLPTLSADNVDFADAYPMAEVIGTDLRYISVVFFHTVLTGQPNPTRLGPPQLPLRSRRRGTRLHVQAELLRLHSHAQHKPRH